MVIERLNCDFSVCKVTDYSLAELNNEFCFIGKTDNEKSLVCLTADVPSDTTDRVDGWKAFRIRGTLDFSLVGILARISAILAEHKIGIFAISTFDTDYVLVKKENFAKASSVLKDGGYTVDDGD